MLRSKVCMIMNIGDPITDYYGVSLVNIKCRFNPTLILCKARLGLNDLKAQCRREK